MINNLVKKRKGDSYLTWLFIFMIIVFVVMGFSNPSRYFHIDNFTSMAFQFPEIGIISIGVMLAMLSGGIDLSMVGTANLAGIVSAYFIANAIPKDAAPATQALYIGIAFLIVIVVGLLCGLVNGFLISEINIPPILATLGTMQAFMGIAIILSEGKAILGFPEVIAEIGNGSLFGVIPYPLIFFVVVTVVLYILLHKTTFGIKLYMMGTNMTASEFSGIDNAKMLKINYMISGVLAGIAGFLLIARTNQAKADYGTTYTLHSILVVVLGGINPNGGFGSIGGIVIALLTLQFLSTGMNMLSLTNVNFLKDLIWGLVLALVMIFNFLRTRHNENKRIRNAKKA